MKDDEMKKINIKDNDNANTGEIVLYQPDNTLHLEVRLKNETIWLTQAQIAELFGIKRPAITKHLNNIYQTGELEKNNTCSILEHVGNNDKQIYQTKFYNLDAILSVGYRVNSIYATRFRRWANKILKEYLFRGYVVNQRIGALERKVFEHDQKFDLLINTALPPREGIFYDGQIFDAYAFVADLVKSAKNLIVLIDNYVDESVLLLLSKRVAGVEAVIYTSQVSAQLQLDLQRHNAQYPSIELREFTKSHDRFLIIDNTVYHIGASLKDLGKKWFAFCKMDINANLLLGNL
jgi:hypothetical protein